MKKLDLLAAVLLIVGGLNWGLVAIAKFDLVAAIFGLDFGETNAVTRVVYGLVGPAADCLRDPLTAEPVVEAPAARPYAAGASHRFAGGRG
jgi:uncharacterized membrane protein YuzA (DUF378 family)